jgi:glycosyltransferase involved in cell wall biosynthesis
MIRVDMKIAVDCRYIGKSGVGTYIENFVDRLLEDHSEHQYLFICEKCAGMVSNKNVEIFETEIKPFSLKELFCFPVSKINQCDAFFSPYINLPLGIKVPVYCTIHDVIFLDRRELTSWVGYMARKFYIWNAVRISKAVFTVSVFSKKRIRYHFNINKEIIVTFSAISSTIKEAAKLRYEKANPPYIIYVGNIKKHKGLKVLLEGYQKAVENGYESTLYLVGNVDKFRTSDKELTRLIEGNPNVKFTGFLPNEELYRMIAKAELLVLPSYYEGFGLTPLEGLYMGTDVLISDIEVLQEVYSDLPVTFFKCGDAEDLGCKLLRFNHKNEDVEKTRHDIDIKYNIKDICTIILDVISKSA